MAVVPVAKLFTIYYADGLSSTFIAETSLGACIKARKHHSADVVYTTEGTELKYQYNGYGWDNIEAATQRNNALLLKANEFIGAGICDMEQFTKCCDLYNHLIHASIVNLDGQWFIIDSVADPLDFYRCSDMPFLESIVVHAHSYDMDGEDITITWEDLINDLLDGGMELMRVQPMKIS